MRESGLLASKLAVQSMLQHSRFCHIRHIIRKCIQCDRTEYLVGWVGHETDEPSWQAARDIPPGSRYLVNAYNMRLRNEAQRPIGNGGGSGVHLFVGKKVAKDFSHGAVYIGYVTEHYPSVLIDGETATMSDELFHVEYDDGDEEDFDFREIEAAIALASSF